MSLPGIEDRRRSLFAVKDEIDALSAAPHVPFKGANGCSRTPEEGWQLEPFVCIHVKG